MLKRSFEIIWHQSQTTDQQDFLQRYGCTGWTEDIVVTLLDHNSDGGLSRLWCRARSVVSRLDGYNSNNNNSGNNSNNNILIFANTNTKAFKHFDFVLA
jgi:hypothetical protein